VYQHLKDLNSERPRTENAKPLKYNRKRLCCIFENIYMSRNEQILFKRTLYSLISYGSNFPHAFKYERKNKLNTGYLNLLHRICESELKLYSCIKFSYLKMWYICVRIGKLLSDRYFGNNVLYLPLCCLMLHLKEETDFMWL